MIRISNGTFKQNKIRLPSYQKCNVQLMGFGIGKDKAVTLGNADIPHYRTHYDILPMELKVIIEKAVTASGT
jgi:hypothetical protein